MSRTNAKTFEDFQRETAREMAAMRGTNVLEAWYSMTPRYTSRYPKASNDRVAASVLRTSGQAATVATRTDGKVMTARFAGKCGTCGGRIAAGETIRYNGQAHHYPACPEQDTSPMAEDDVVDFGSAPEPETAPTGNIADGRYTVEFADGDYRTFRVRTQPANADFAPGAQVIAYLSGPDNESEYTRFGFVRDGKIIPWKRFASETTLVRAAKVLENPEAAAASGLAYALRSNNCCKCGRALTVPASIHAGMGPECAKRG